MYDILQHVILPFQDAEFMGRGTRRLSENGYFPQSLRQTEIIILEILQCIPVVIISAFPRSKSGIFDLILKKLSHSRTASLSTRGDGWFPDPGREGGSKGLQDGL